MEKYIKISLKKEQEEQKWLRGFNFDCNTDGANFLFSSSDKDALMLPETNMQTRMIIERMKKFRYQVVIQKYNTQFESVNFSENPKQN